MLRPRRARVYAGFEPGCSTRSRQCRFDAYGPSEWKSELSELVGRSCISDLLLDSGLPKRVCQNDIQTPSPFCIRRVNVVRRFGNEPFGSVRKRLIRTTSIWSFSPEERCREPFEKGQSRHSTGETALCERLGDGPVTRPRTGSSLVDTPSAVRHSIENPSR